MEVGGYSEDTVGEDMGVVLKLQKKCYGTSHATFIYEKDGFVIPKRQEQSSVYCIKETAGKEDYWTA